MNIKSVYFPKLVPLLLLTAIAVSTKVLAESFNPTSTSIDRPGETSEDNLNETQPQEASLNHTPKLESRSRLENLTELDTELDNDPSAEFLFQGDGRAESKTRASLSSGGR